MMKGKQRGDASKPGKVQPYAYYPLDPKNLNKRQKTNTLLLSPSLTLISQTPSASYWAVQEHGQSGRERRKRGKANTRCKKEEHQKGDMKLFLFFSFFSFRIFSRKSKSLLFARYSPSKITKQLNVLVLPFLLLFHNTHNSTHTRTSHTYTEDV